ncbi:hypothetical protein [Candidatus Villigracilis saccharophilus]|nr:hypothetical protein [Anaerolineales bacterium]
MPATGVRALGVTSPTSRPDTFRGWGRRASPGGLPPLAALFIKRELEKDR